MCLPPTLHEHSSRKRCSVLGVIQRFRKRVRRSAPTTSVFADSMGVWIVACAKLFTPSLPPHSSNSNQNNDVWWVGELSDMIGRGLDVSDMNSDLSCITKCRVQKSSKWLQQTNLVPSFFGFVNHWAWFKISKGFRICSIYIVHAVLKTSRRIWTQSYRTQPLSDKIVRPSCAYFANIYWVFKDFTRTIMDKTPTHALFYSTLY